MKVIDPPTWARDIWGDDVLVLKRTEEFWKDAERAVVGYKSSYNEDYLDFFKPSDGWMLEDLVKPLFGRVAVLIGGGGLVIPGSPEVPVSLDDFNTSKGFQERGFTNNDALHFPCGNRPCTAWGVAVYEQAYGTRTLMFKAWFGQEVHLQPGHTVRVEKGGIRLGSA